MSATATAPTELKKGLSGKAKFFAILAVVVVATYLLAVTPVRTYIQQQQEMRAAEQRYAVLAETNKQLQARATELQSDAEIKRLARERYELVEPGQQAYAVMPPSPTVTDQATQASPARAQAEVDKKHSLLERAWNTVNPWN